MKKKLKILTWNIAVFLVLCALVEAVLWWRGEQPGIAERSPWFKRVGELRVLEGYTVDSAGIQKVALGVRPHLSDFIAGGGVRPFWWYKYQVHKGGDKVTHFYILGVDYLKIIEGDFENEFSDFVNELQLKDSLSETDSAYLEYLRNPINAEGFRSIRFKDYDTDKTKVLLLGDSFTWGHTTVNKTDSFADLLITKGHVVFNTGISGADLPQYHAVADKYIPRLKPDVVIANIYMGNDIALHDRVLSPNRPVFYATNAGNLYTSPQGINLGSVDSVYQHILDMASIPNQDTYLFNRLMAKTRFSTLLWRVLKDTRLGGHPIFYNGKFQKHSKKYRKIWDETGYAINRRYLERMDSICQAHDAAFLPVLIPDARDISPSPARLAEELDRFRYHLPTGLSPSDYDAGDGHFNEAGHRRYADFLDSLIRDF